MTDQGGSGGHGGARAAFAGWWAVLFGLWIALANKADAQEVVAGLVCGAIAAGAAVAVRQERRVVPRPRAAWLARLPRPLRAVPADLWRLARALGAGLRGRPPEGEMLTVPIEAGDDPRDAARRVLVAAGGSIAPNTVVVGIDEEAGVLVVHRLMPAPGDPRAQADPLGLT
jgi:multisubunit Na+/H+ antiporter MnhE subunit